jgi:hypothetical protein
VTASPGHDMGEGPRRIVQIALCEGDRWERVVALCDDNTLWTCIMRVASDREGMPIAQCGPWGELPPIPQPLRLPAQD